MTTTANNKSSRLVVYAPGIHTGGGLTLLKALTQSSSYDPDNTTFILDSRVLPLISITKSEKILAITPTLTGRLNAEQQLHAITRSGGTLLCLHSLPPLRRSSAKTYCFVQNILHLGGFPLVSYPMKPRLRLTLERILAKFLRKHVDHYIVQSQTMLELLNQWHGDSPPILIAPFAQTPATQTAVNDKGQKLADFIYVADGLPHKNHQNLIQAWLLLAEQGFYPQLILTLTERDLELQKHILNQVKHKGIKIKIVQSLSRQEVVALYHSVKALIYPSYAESLGLPLVEAAALDLPIVAAELDYVRDVCQPAETFNPSSPRSIARAVRRFMDTDEAPRKLLSADEFFDKLRVQNYSQTGGLG